MTALKGERCSPWRWSPQPEIVFVRNNALGASG
jgi:hypothetical protein